MSLIQYVVVHETKDRGVIAVQAIHAATECLGKEDVPVPSDTRLCVLVAKNSSELEDLATNLSFSAIPFTLIREPDAPYNNSATAVGVAPGEQERLKPFFTSFKLLR